jgi:hypothetical protein
MRNESMPETDDADRVIDALGGTVKVASLCKVTPQAVTQWRSKGLPASRRMYLEVVRPDVFAIDGEALTAAGR